MRRTKRWLLLTIVFLAGVLAAIFTIEWLGGPLRASELGLPYTEGVLVPRFIAAFNEWRAKRPDGPDRFQTIDIKDRARWEAALDAFDKIKREMKNAGY